MAKNWAICIGINQYDNLPPLRCAVRDAELMRDWFLEEAGFEKVYYFSDDSPPIGDFATPYPSRPTGNALKKFFRTRFDEPFLTAGDNLWFFYSGHGLRHQDRDYLMPSDSDPHPGGVEETAISLQSITERLRRCGADNVVLLLDACRDQNTAKGIGIGKEKQNGVITICSCSPNERSYELERLGQGTFTFALLEALRIQGEGNCATVERLYNQLCHRVIQINQQYQKPRQTPYAMVEPATKYHLILLPRQATVRDAEILKTDAWREERQGNYEAAEQLWIRVLTVSPADGDAIEAIRHFARSGRKRRVSSVRNNSISRSVNFPRLTLPTVRFPEIAMPSISRRRMLQWLGWGAAGVCVVVVGKNVPYLVSLLPKPELTSKPKPLTNIPNAKTEVRLGDSKVEFVVLTVNAKGEEISRERQQAKYYRENLGNGVELEMISIPSGTFLMGTDDEEIERLNKKFETNWFNNEKPQRQVTVAAFSMGKFPVTQKQWQQVADLPKIKIALNPKASHFKGEALPIESITWNEAVEFCERLSKKTGKIYRLPSEAEWEYACRAGTTTPFHFGATITGELANYNTTYIFAQEAKGIYRQKTTSVGNFSANTFGLYGMHGNVYEWCADTWHKNYEDAPIDGTPWISTNRQDSDNKYKMLRGGSWSNYSHYCRSAFRFEANGISDRFDNFGFRVVCGGFGGTS